VEKSAGNYQKITRKTIGKSLENDWNFIGKSQDKSRMKKERMSGILIL